MGDTTFGILRQLIVLLLKALRWFGFSTEDLRAASHKYRPKSTFGGTSQKIDFAHILLIGRP